MGTNYYAVILPTKERKKELIEAINDDDACRVNELSQTLYGDINSYNQSDFGVLHLGKRSGGWKFLWDPNIYTNYSYENNIKTYYPFSKDGIRKFLDKPNIFIIDEYYNYDKTLKHKYTVDGFMDMALNWDTDGLDSKEYYMKYPRESYIEYNPNLKILGINSSYNDFYSDGLRFSVRPEFS